MRSKKYRIIRMIILGETRFVVIPPKNIKERLYYEESFKDAIARIDIIEMRYREKIAKSSTYGLK